MRSSKLKSLVAVAVVAILPVTATVAQGPSGVRITGAELEAWIASDQMAVAGIGSNDCHWITKGPLDARSQTVYCPNSAPFTITGQAQVRDEQLCSKFMYPDGSRYEACQEIYKVGDNKYEARVGGVARNIFYRLVR
jgi:hypothetical protein